MTSAERLGEVDATFLEAVVQTSSAFVAKLTPVGEILYVNHHWHGSSPGSVLGRSIFDFIAPEERLAIRACLEQVTRTGEASSFDTVALGTFGEHSNYHCRVGPVLREGCVVALAVIAEDVTQAKRMSEHHRQMQKTEAVGQLAAGVAHNFNNTLQGIVGNIDLARMHVSDANVLPFLDNALNACSEARRLVKDLLLFAGKQVRPQREVVSLSACIERVLSMCRLTFDKMISLQLNVINDVPPLPVQPHELEHALFNLLLNARDAVVGEQRPVITVELELLSDVPSEPPGTWSGANGGQHACIRVRDNGVGLSSEVQQRAFEPFFTTKAPGQATGLGLATVLACARQHGGWAHAEAPPAGGAMVSIWLPYPESAPAAPAAAMRAPTSAQSPSVLVVDDDELVRDSVARVLRFAGFTTHTASSGNGALAFVEAADPLPALILLDESMPDLDGTAVRQRLAKIAAGVKVIVISGHGTLDLNCDGADAVLEKPVRATKLLETVGQVLGVSKTGVA